MIEFRKYHVGMILSKMIVIIYIYWHDHHDALIIFFSRDIFVALGLGIG
jgi:hypothetical protein